MNFKVLANNWLGQQRGQGYEPNSLPNLRELREAQRAEHQEQTVDTVSLSSNPAK